MTTTATQAIVSGARTSGAALIMFLFACWLASRDLPRADVLPTTVSAATPLPTHPSPADSRLTPALVVATNAEAGDEPDRGLTDLVHEKYRFLLDDPASGEGADLLRALRARERAAVRLNTARQDPSVSPETGLRYAAELARLDGEVSRVLPAGTQVLFQLLANSDMEQFQVEDFTGGISQVAPLSEEHRRELLLAKLGHREAFRRALDSTGFLDGATRAQRRAALPAVLQALEQSHHGFLQEARQQLTTEQFELLRNYEDSEYAGELAKLRERGG